MRKHMKRLATFALAAVLAVGMGTTVLAEEPVQEEKKNAEAYITKEFQMPEGTTTPTSTFTFNVTPVSVDGANYDKKNMPSSQDVTISYTAADTATAGNDGTVKIVKSEQVFKGTVWPHAGVYVYTITEADSGVTTDAEKYDETVKYSKASYTATVLVKNKDDGTLYVDNILVKKDKDDAGQETGGSDKDKKVDPSKPDEKDPTKDGGLRFVNTYTKKIKVTPVKPDPDPDNPGKTDDNDKQLGVKKIVTGDLGDKTKGFEFTVKVTAPALADTDTYKAKIVGPDSADDSIVSFSSGTDYTIKLKHGQELVFTDLHVGASYEVQETDNDTNYTAKTYNVENSGTPQEQEGKKQITGKVSEGSDLVSVVNNRTDTTPTGIVINNLPFILMIAAVLGGFAAYIAARRRRS